MTGEKQHKKKQKPSGWRLFLFYGAAISVVLFPLAIIEILLWVFVSPPPVNPNDPFVSFHGILPLFTLNAGGDRYEIGQERLEYFYPDSFAAEKGKNTFRIFCLGGSTVAGRPYSIETSFTTWLKLDIDAARPEANCEVVNCGGVSYASYRLVPILKELLNYQPDLFILYTGQNEFLEDRTYASLKRMPPALVRLHQAWLNLRGYTLAFDYLISRRARAIADEKAQRTTLPTEVQATLDARDGLDAYHRDEDWRQGIIIHFHHNLDTMIRMAREANVPIILVNPVSNLKNCPPFKSEFWAYLTKKQLERVTDLWKQADEPDGSNVHEKISLLTEAAKIDDRHAGLLYSIGKCYESIGRFSEAKTWLIRAKEEDICPLRILEHTYDAIFDIASQYEIPLVDVRKLIEDRTPDGIPGNEWLVDHVHPSIAAHQLIADALYQTIEHMGFVQTPDNWRSIRDALWEKNLASLDESYYEFGAIRLQNLNNWARNRVPGPAQ